MATSRSPNTSRIRDFGTRKIISLGRPDDDCRGITLPNQILRTDFPVDIGSELTVELREPENELVLVPATEE